LQILVEQLDPLRVAGVVGEQVGEVAGAVREVVPGLQLGPRDEPFELGGPLAEADLAMIAAVAGRGRRTGRAVDAADLVAEPLPPGHGKTSTGLPEGAERQVRAL